MYITTSQQKIVDDIFKAIAEEKGCTVNEAQSALLVHHVESVELRFNELFALARENDLV